MSVIDVKAARRCNAARPAYHDKGAKAADGKTVTSNKYIRFYSAMATHEDSPITVTQAADRLESIPIWLFASEACSYLP